MDEFVRLDIPARAEYVVLGRLALSGLLRRRAGFSDDAVADLKLALTEACSNSVRHAYDHEDGKVHLEFHMGDDRVVVSIRDEGAGFHEYYEDCPECRNLEGLPPVDGGLGISIIRAVVDGFDLQRPDEGGTILVLTKRTDA
jgi:serine/threonine-protein kinase RsbW